MIVALLMVLVSSLWEIDYASLIMAKFSLKVYAGGFEDEIEQRMADIASFLKKEYKAITGDALSLTKEENLIFLYKTGQGFGLGSRHNVCSRLAVLTKSWQCKGRGRS